MLYDTIITMSDLIGIDSSIIPNIITFVVVVGIVILTFKSQLTWISILGVYGISMAILSILGIESVFNIVTIVANVVT